MQSRDATTDKKIEDDLLRLMKDNNSMVKAEAKKLYDKFFNN